MTPRSKAMKQSKLVQTSMMWARVKNFRARGNPDDAHGRLLRLVASIFPGREVVQIPDDRRWEGKLIIRELPVGFDSVVDVALPDLKLAFENDESSANHSQTRRGKAAEDERDRKLRKLGWAVVHARQDEFSFLLRPERYLRKLIREARRGQRKVAAEWMIHDPMILEPKSCACGCGEMTTSARNRFIKGHHLRTDLNPRKRWAEKRRENAA